MSTAILQTKLHIPVPSPTYMPRPRLHQILDDGLGAGHRLILVSAPAGFGKTTMVSEWISQEQIDTAWVSLDEHDDDPTRILIYLISTLQTVDPTLGDDLLSIIESPEPPQLETSFTALLNQLDALSDPLLIVLDDFHLITSKSIHQSLEFFIENLPPHCHLMLLSRADPPLPLARLRARGQMTEVRAADLRFTAAEIVPFFKKVMQLEITPEQAQSLEARTEGWIAGLQMAALSLKGKSEIDEFITAFSGSHRFVLDYLTEEVFQTLPEELRNFVLNTAILDRFCGPLCEAVSGQQGGQDILEKLEEANLFLVPLDDERLWFRYHRLFADVMANRLQRINPGKISKLHLRAAQWFQEHDLPGEAVDHALAGGNYQTAAAIVESQSLELLKAGNLAMLSGWLSKFPPEIVASRPELGITSAWVHMLAGRMENIEASLGTAEKNLHRLEETENLDQLRGQAAAIRAYLAAHQENLDEALKMANLALELLPEDDLSVRCVVVFVLGGVHYMQQDMAGAFSAMQEAARLGMKSGNIHVAVPALNSIGEVLLQQGNLAEAEKTLRQALQLGTSQSGKPSPISAGVQSALAELYIARGDLFSARQFAETGVDLGEIWANPDSQLGCYLALARIEHLEKNRQEAQVNLEKARHLAATHQLAPGQDQQIAACEAFISGAASGRIDQSALPDPLTERELEVLQLLAEGLSNRAISDNLIIALGTTKTHISRIMGKLNAENRTQAVVVARELGLI